MRKYPVNIRTYEITTYAFRNQVPENAAILASMADGSLRYIDQRNILCAGIRRFIQMA